MLDNLLTLDQRRIGLAIERLVLSGSYAAQLRPYPLRGIGDGRDEDFACCPSAHIETLRPEQK